MLHACALPAPSAYVVACTVSRIQAYCSTGRTHERVTAQHSLGSSHTPPAAARGRVYHWAVVGWGPLLCSTFHMHAPRTVQGAGQQQPQWRAASGAGQPWGPSVLVRTLHPGPTPGVALQPAQFITAHVACLCIACALRMRGCTHCVTYTSLILSRTHP